MIIVYSKGFYIIVFEYIIRGYSAYQQFDLGVKIGLGVTNTLSLIAYFLFVFYSRRIFKLNMLS